MDSELWGREVALNVGADFLAAASRSSHCLVFSGEPGIGKTAVWQTVLDRGRSAGFCALVARAAHSEVALTHVGLTDLLSTVLDETLVALPKPQREALEVGLLRSELSFRSTQQRVLATAFLSTVRIVATQGPVLIAIDDMHWCPQPLALRT
jgi:predicted ATPase